MREVGQSNRLAEVISALRAKQADLAARGVTRLAVFGSTARGDNRGDSDVDLLVEIDDGANMSLTGFARLKLDLEDYLHIEVDLAEGRNLDKRLATKLDRDTVVVF